MGTFEKTLFQLMMGGNIGSGIVQLFVGNYGTAMMNFGIAYLIYTIR